MTSISHRVSHPSSMRDLPSNVMQSIRTYFPEHYLSRSSGSDFHDRHTFARRGRDRRPESVSDLAIRERRLQASRYHALRYITGNAMVTWQAIGMNL